MIRWIFALSTICLPTRSEPTRSDNINNTIDNSIKVKDFLRDDDEELKLLSLSLSLSLREYRSINKKFHKTSKIKNMKSIDGELKMSRFSCILKQTSSSGLWIWQIFLLTTWISRRRKQWCTIKRRCWFWLVLELEKRWQSRWELRIW